jgi:hypothetical protein
MREVYWEAVGAPSPAGFSYLNLALRVSFAGWGTLTLPNIGGGAKVNYSTSAISVIAVSNGTQNVTSGVAYGVVSRPHPTDTTKIIVHAMDPVPGTPTAIPATMYVAGMQLI